MKQTAVHLKTIMIIMLMILGLWLTTVHTGQADTEVSTASRSRADYDFSIEFIDPAVSLFPNKREIVDAKLENLGTMDDTYVLDINQVPTSEGWTVTFDNTELSREYSVSALNSLLIPLVVDPPASGSAFITLKAKSKTSGENHTALIELNVKQPIIKLMLDVKEKTSMPGEDAVFEMNVSNLQDVPENVTITLTGTDITPGETSTLKQWTYTIEPTRILVMDVNSSRIVKIHVHTPTEPVPNQIGAFTIRAEAESDTENPMEETITVTVKKLDLVEGTPTPALAKGKPGDEVGFTVKLLNNGTGDLEEISLFKGDLPAGWEIIYDPSQKYQLERNEKKDVTLKVKIPSFATMGQFKLQMIVQAQFGNPIGNFTMQVEVLQRFGVALSNIERTADPSTGKQLYVVDYQRDSDAYVVLKNTGNGRDTIVINTTNVPNNWIVYFKSIEPATGLGLTNVTGVDFKDDVDLTGIFDANQKYFADPQRKTDKMSVILDPDDQVKITLGINTSFNGELMYNFSLAAYTTDPSVFSKVPMDIRLIRSELVVTDLALSELVPRVDDVVVITATVVNDYHVPAENITVSLKVSDLKVGEEQISILPPGKDARVDFRWTPTKKGNYPLEIVITGPMITSGAEPLLIRNITVEDAPPEVDGNGDDITPVLLIIAVIVVLTVLVLVMFLVSRDKLQLLKIKRKEELQKKGTGNGNGVKKESDTPPAVKETPEKPKAAKGRAPGRSKTPPPRPGRPSPPKRK